MRQGLLSQTLLDAVEATTTTTSDPISLAGVKKASIYFKATDISGGNGVFAIEASINGTDWFTYNKLIDNVANSNVQNKTRVAGATLSSNGTKLYTIDPDDVIAFIRAKVTVTTNGKYSAFVLTQR